MCNCDLTKGQGSLFPIYSALNALGTALIIVTIAKQTAHIAVQASVGAHNAHAMVWPVVSKPPVKKTPISAANRSSGKWRPVLGSLSLNRWPPMVTSSSEPAPSAFKLSKMPLIKIRKCASCAQPRRTSCRLFVHHDMFCAYAAG